MFSSSEPAVLIVMRLLLEMIQRTPTSQSTMITWLQKQYEKCQEYLLKEVE